MKRILRSQHFWLPFIITLVVTVPFFAWELGLFEGILPTPPRPQAPDWEILFSGMIAFLLSLDAGLVIWESRFGSCPRGVKRATSVAGVIGAITLLCPACLLLPASIIGISVVFGFLAPFLPILRIISVLLLVIVTGMLWPRK